MICIEDVSFAYGNCKVLQNISMTLKEGCIYGLLGENGVGKTTLLTLVAGLKKPESGSIRIGGRDPYDRKPSLLSEIYFLSEDVTAHNMRAEDFALTYGRFRERFDMARFLEIMAVFETDPHKKMNAMSYGQLKKTYIAFALSCGCRYLFMDEPTNGLDIPSKSQFRKVVMKYMRDDATVVISTHQVRDLENIIDPIIILDRNNVLLNASLEEISQRLYFDYGFQRRQDALYSELTPGGNIQVCFNHAGEESKVSIEALFNTVHIHKELFK